MSMYPIATSGVLSGGQSSVTFSSIPSTFTHLQLRCYALPPGTQGLYIQANFNGDTGTNYAIHEFEGAASIYQAGYGSQTYMRFCGAYNSGSNLVGYPVVSIVDILDYANTNKNKTSRVLTGSDSNNSVGGVALQSNLWVSTAAVTSMTLYAYSSGSLSSFAANSKFDLYGIYSSSVTGV